MIMKTVRFNCFKMSIRLHSPELLLICPISQRHTHHKRLTYGYPDGLSQPDVHVYKPSKNINEMKTGQEVLVTSYHAEETALYGKASSICNQH